MVADAVPAALATPAGRRWRWLLSLAILAALWQVAAMLAGSPALPPPAAVAAAAWQHLVDGDLLRDVAITLARVAVAFAAAMLIGSVVGFVLGRSRVLDELFDGWLVIALNMPALVTIVLCYIWFGLNEAAAVVAVAVNKAPLVVAITREGARTLDRSLLEMAQLFAIPRGRVLRRIVLPQLAPSLMAAARSGLALTWKIVLVVELLGRPNGVGFQIRSFFNFFDIAGILAYTLVFIAVILAIEACILKPLDRAAGRWRAP
ncbi:MULTISPECIES: ABC transporter permease [unclassified Inquilinus]|uniref:ABC transporter permease n=1 Tax=unclassified Inquilinus TaxID=2645927 RepID=UPI003F8FFF6E